MRARQFRPNFDRLGLRITPSDLVPATSVVAMAPAVVTGTAAPAGSRMPGDDIDARDCVIYTRTGGSGVDPICYLLLNMTYTN